MKRITTALGDIALAVVALSLSAATTAADKACDQDLDIIPAALWRILSRTLSSPNASSSCTC